MLAQALPQPRQTLLHQRNARKRCLVERSVTLGHKRRHAQRDADGLGQLGGKAHQLVDVIVRLLGQPHDHVNLQRAHSILGSQHRRVLQVLLFGTALDNFAHALARSVASNRQRAIATARQQAHQLIGQAVRAQRANTDL